MNVVRVQIEEMTRSTPEQFLGMVMNIERYALVDKKISPVLWQHRDGDLLRFEITRQPAPATRTAWNLYEFLFGYLAIFESNHLRPRRLYGCQHR